MIINHPMKCFPLAFESILGFWDVHPLVPDHLDSVRQEILPKARKDQSFVDKSTSSAPTGPQYFLKTGQIVGQRFCG